MLVGKLRNHLEYCLKSGSLSRNKYTLNFLFVMPGVAYLCYAICRLNGIFLFISF